MLKKQKPWGYYTFERCKAIAKKFKTRSKFNEKEPSIYNFDFINYHLILQDKKWNQLFKPAKILVLDEAHSYTSFHGSNVYHVIKRMKKYMKDLHYVGSSATLDNSKEL